LGLESKFFDTGKVPTSCPAVTLWTSCEVNPTATLLMSTPPQGVSEQARQGNRIRITSVQVRGLVTALGLEGQASPGVGAQCIVALVLDTQTNGVALSSEDVFTNPTNSVTTSMCPLRNLQYAQRFRVLKTWELDLSPKAVTQLALNDYAWAPLQQRFDCYLPLSLNVNFNDDTQASVAAVVDNSLHLIANCSSVSVGCTIAYQARIRFKD